MKSYAGFVVFLYYPLSDLQLFNYQRKIYIAIFPKEEKILSYNVKIIAHLKETDKTHSYRAKMEYWLTDKWHKSNIDVLLYFSKTCDIKLHSGDRVLVEGSPSIIEAPKNYGEFDYQFYQRANGIYFRDFLSERDVIFYKSSTETKSYLEDIRIYISNVLSNTLEQSKEVGVATALLMGDRSQLDQQLTLDYANSGTIHVLAVSGLHVGIIFLIVSALLKSFPFKWLKALIILVILWNYAILTGLSPSRNAGNIDVLYYYYRKYYFKNCWNI